MKTAASEHDYRKENRFIQKRYLIFCLLSIVYLLVYFHRQATAVLALDLMRDLHLDGSALGLLGAAYFYPYAGFQLLAGPITNSLGARKTLCLFFGLAGVGALGFAAAPNLPIALGFRVLVGVGAALILVPILEIVSRQFAKDQFTTMVGVLIAGAGIGVFVGAGPLGYLDHLLGWRGSFLVVGGLSLCVIACTWGALYEQGKKSDEARSNPRTAVRQQSLRVLSTAAFWPPVIWAFLAVGIFSSFGGLWGGPWLMHAYGLDKIQTGHVLSMLALGMIVGGPLFGYLAERVLQSRKKMLICAAAILILLTARLAFGPHLAFIELYAWFGLLGLSTMAAAPLALSLVRDSFPNDLAPTVTGLANFFFLAGGAIMQQIGGWLLTAQQVAPDVGGHANYIPLLLVNFACSLVAFGAASLTRE